MTVALYFIIMFANLYCSLKRQKFGLLNAISTIYFGLVYFGNIRDGESDLGRYRFQYVRQTSSIDSSIWQVEKGYGYLADFFSKSGVPFQIFLLAIFVVCFFLIFQLIKEFNCNYSVFILLYGCFFYFFTLEVIRFFVACAILMLGVKFLLHKKYLFFILCVIIATLFHKSFIVYLILIFSQANFNRGFVKKYYKLILLGLFVFLGLIFANGNKIPFLKEIYLIIFRTWKINLYIESKTHFGWIPYIVYYLFTLTIIIISGKLIDAAKLNNSNTNAFDKISKYQKLCLKSIILVAFDLPLVMVNVDYFRIFFAVSLMSFILFAAGIGECYTSKVIEVVLLKNNIKPLKPIYIYSNNNIGYLQRQMITVLLMILAWTIIWWNLNLNNISIIDALKENMFYLF